MKKLQIIFLLSIMGLGSLMANAQSGSTDVLEKGQVYVEANLWTSTQSHQNGGMQIYGGRFSYGLTKKVEIGVNASFSQPHDPEYPPEIQPHIKWKFYENEKAGVKASGGVIFYLPVAKRVGTNTFGFVYANVSKDVKKLKDARFTFGGYSLVHHNKCFGSGKGFNIVYDQPLTRKIAVSTQWLTGKNRFGYLTPGVSFSLPKNMSLFTGYSIGNYGYDNHGPFISLGISRF